jgi:hypothetical protein
LLYMSETLPSSELEDRLDTVICFRDTSGFRAVIRSKYREEPLLLT